MRGFWRQLVPGVLVSAAFIGPGTVTVCTLAGVNFGYGLIWALVLSIISCIVLQEMSARLGLISQKGLSENIRQELKSPVLRFFALALVFSAIAIGNAAYEAGNITGAVLGLESVFGIQQLSFGQFQLNLWSVLIGVFAFVLLYLGNYKSLERFFIALVFLMSLSFLFTALITRPDLEGILRGFLPSNISAGILSIMALVGTTVVPYNLFLHASRVGEKWKDASFLPVARMELSLAIILGGVVSMAIVICAAAANVSNVSNAADLALGVQPLFGDFAGIFMATGLLAAGITSAITAPLAAAYVVKGCFGWKDGLKSKNFRLVWASVLLLGVFFSSLQLNPVEIIRFAQIANGILLPVIAIFLLWIVNRPTVLGKYRNSLKQNLLALVVIGIAVFLGIKSVYRVIQSF